LKYAERNERTEKMLKNKKEGAIHLSKNTYVHHYAEGPCERLSGLLMEYHAREDAGTVQDWINHETRHDSRIGQVFNRKESVEYLDALQEFRPHFNDDTIFSIKFCIEALQQVSGSVSEHVLLRWYRRKIFAIQMLTKTIIHGQKVLKGMYVDQRCELAEGNRLDKYMEEVERLPHTQYTEDWKNTVNRSWNGIVMHSGSALYAKELLMKSMDEYDEFFKLHFSKQDLLFMIPTELWKQDFDNYVETMQNHADSIAQQPETDEGVSRLRIQLPGKVRFAMSDHFPFISVPVFPLLTKSVIPKLKEALASVELALSEVSQTFYQRTSYRNCLKSSCSTSDGFAHGAMNITQSMTQV
jgi:hypothetical protein